MINVPMSVLLILLMYASVLLSKDPLLNTHVARPRSSNTDHLRRVHSLNHHRPMVGVETNESTHHHHTSPKVYSSRYDIYSLLDMLRDELRNASIHSRTCRVLFSIDEHAIAAYRRLLDNRHLIETKVCCLLYVI